MRLQSIMTERAGNTALPYQDPDEFFGENEAFPFFYTADHRMYYGEARGTHGQIISKHNDLYQRYVKLFGAEFKRSFDSVWGNYRNKVMATEAMANTASLQATASLQSAAPASTASFNNKDHKEHLRKLAMIWRNNASSIDLLGRIGSSRNIASFWNDDKNVLSSLLGGCTKQLVDDNSLREDGSISTPLHGTVPLSGLQTAGVAALNDAQRHELELRQRMHVAKWDQKPDIMKQLGLQNGGGKPHKMQTALRKAKLHVPGQKWWAPTSEHKLQCIALTSVNEAKQASSEALVSALTNLGILKPFNRTHAVSFILDPNDEDKLAKCKALIKHAKWQIHSMSKTRKAIYIDATPLKNEKYRTPVTLYHITNKTELPSITANGLGLRSETPGMRYPKRVYLYPTKEMAVSRHRMAAELKRFANKPMEDPVLLSIDNQSGKYTTFIDPEYHMGMGGDDEDKINVPIYTTKTVHPSDITVVG